ncbi:MAG: hypothetical protein M3O07_12955 [Pseudomonadota bacterium]|nr:hypothetical protein [Pseudomonadota bacterium]
MSSRVSSRVEDIALKDSLPDGMAGAALYTGAYFMRQAHACNNSVTIAA